MSNIDMKIALWSVNFAYPVKSAKEWLDLLAKIVDEAKKAGCELLVLPEYVSAHWLHWAPPTLREGVESMRWMAEEGEKLLPQIAALVEETGIGLIAGTMPHRSENKGYFNRCWALLPGVDKAADKKVNHFYHNKLVATPSEKEGAKWPIQCGQSLTLIEWRGYKLAILICLDVEMPTFIAELQKEKIDLLIVPSMTSALSGYHRVFDCAKASAVMLFSAVAVVGGIGELPLGMGTMCAGAALYVPCETGLRSLGSLASIGPMTKTEGKGPLSITEVPIAKIRKLHSQGPEAWPGPSFMPALAPERFKA